MLSQKELSEVSKLLEDFSPPVTFYERDSLVPQMRNRLNYIIEIFEEFIEICKEPGLADRINGAVAVLGNSEFAKKANYTPPVVGREYLDGVIRVCETQFIGDI